MKRQILAVMAGLVLFVTGAQADWIYYSVSGAVGESWWGSFDVGMINMPVLGGSQTHSVSASGFRGSETIPVTSGDPFLNTDIVEWRNMMGPGDFVVRSAALYGAVNAGRTWAELLTVNGGVYAVDAGGAVFSGNTLVYGGLGGNITFSSSAPSAVPEPGMAGLAVFGGLLMVRVGRWMKGGSQKSPVAA